MTTEAKIVKALQQERRLERKLLVKIKRATAQMSGWLYDLSASESIAYRRVRKLAKASELLVDAHVIVEALLEDSR